MRDLGLFMFCIGLAACAASAHANEATRLVPKSQWIAAPTAAEYARALSAKAAANASNGLATLECNATDAGALTGCKVISEYPKGLDLGRSALELAPSIRIGPEAGKASAAGKVRTPIYFSIHPDGPPVIQNPDWSSFPSADELRTWSGLSIGKLQGAAVAVVKCTVNADGHLENCQVLRETPPGMGYGAAAMKVAAHLRMFPQLRAGEPVSGAKVELPLQF